MLINVQLEQYSKQFNIKHNLVHFQYSRGVRKQYCDVTASPGMAVGFTGKRVKTIYTERCHDKGSKRIVSRA